MPTGPFLTRPPTISRLAARSYPGYDPRVTRLFEEAIATVARLPDSQQDVLARVLLQLAGVEQPPVILTAEEHADLDEAEAEIERGELATADEVRAMWEKYDL